MKTSYKFTTIQLFLSILVVMFAFSSGNCAEIDDSAVFIEAFNAYQQKDYLLAIEKCDQLNQVFPESPLRDVALLLIARASLKAGENERAAKATATFSTDFPQSSLKTSLEDELKLLAARHQRGEVIAANKALQTSAHKVRTERLARERAVELKLELERAAKAKAELERVAQIKLEEEHREKERLRAEKLAKASVKAAVNIHEASPSFPVGSTGTLPVEITNRGKTSEEFLVTVVSEKEYGVTLTKAGKPDEAINRIKLLPGEILSGSLAFRIPTQMVDGHRSAIAVKAESTKFPDISFQKDAVVTTSAPLVRAVAKLAKQKVTPGEKLRYKVTIINVGSLPAHNLTVRLQLPPEVDFEGTSDVSFKQEQDGTLVFKADRVETGKLAEINMDVKIRDNVTVGKQLRGEVEVINGNLQRKDIFTTTASIVVAAK
jgi:uncharacterized repeat protein (TIGR01451 family)